MASTNELLMRYALQTFRADKEKKEEEIKKRRLSIEKLDEKISGIEQLLSLDPQKRVLQLTNGTKSVLEIVST